MPKSPAGQLSLDALFDTTAISSGFTLGAESVAHPSYDDDEDATAAASTVAFRPPAKNWRLAGHRALARTWKGRAADNLAAIRLLQDLEREDRAATADEQDRLAKFTAFGGGDLSQSMFRRAGEPFRPGWEEMGHELEEMVSAAEFDRARARDAVCPLHPRIHRALHVGTHSPAWVSAGGSILEPGCGTGLFMSTDAGEPWPSKTSADRHRGRSDYRAHRGQPPLSGRLDPQRGFHQGAALTETLRLGDRQPALL